MSLIIYPAPLYAFLAFANRTRGESSPQSKTKILDCAAGGETPPLGLFHEYGYETWGIDISPQQIQLAQAFGEKHNMVLNLRVGDMRQLPFDDDTFDCVYEYNSIAHLSKVDTGLAIKEMFRVLKKGGLCFVGFMSLDCWPILGRRVNDGEFCLIEGDQEVTHSAYTDNEPDQYFASWKILQKEKNTRWFRWWSAQLSKADWMSWFDQAHSDLTSVEWEQMYPNRIERGNNTNLYYVAQKPE